MGTEKIGKGCNSMKRDFRGISHLAAAAALFLCLICLAGCGQTDLDAAETRESAELVSNGDCGKTVTYAIYGDGTLVISGQGEMYDYEMEGSAPSTAQPPWYLNWDIKEIIISDGVTKIGQWAFHYNPTLKNVVISDSVTTVGWGAFANCSALKTVTLGKGVSEIEAMAFFGCDSLEDVWYTGTQEQLNSILVGSGNDPLLDASFHRK